MFNNKFILTYRRKILFFSIPCFKIFTFLYLIKDYISKIIDDERYYNIRAYVDSSYTKYDIVGEVRKEKKK